MRDLPEVGPEVGVHDASFESVWTEGVDLHAPRVDGGDHNVLVQFGMLLLATVAQGLQGEGTSGCQSCADARRPMCQCAIQ